MKVKLAQWGNSAAIRLPRAIVEELGLKPGQLLDVTRSGTAIRLEPGSKAYPPVIEPAWLWSEMDRLGPKHRPSPLDWGPDVGAEIIND